MATLKRALESNLTLNLLASALALFLAGFFWVDMQNSLSASLLNILIRYLIIIIGLIAIYLIWNRSFPSLPILYLVYTGCYFLYQLMFAQSRPIWIVLLALFVLLWLIFPIFRVKEKHGIYFFLLVLVLFEVFLALAYWLVNPLTRCLIMAIAAYLFGGWLITVNNKSKDLPSYFWYAIISLLIVILTTHWGL